MNSLPGVNDILALLDALKKNVRELAAREEKLESEFRQLTATALRDFETRSQAQETAAHEREMRATETFQAEQAGCQARFDRRKGWINNAHAAMSRNVLRQINDQDTLWKEHTQQSLQDAERRRDEELAAANTAYENFQQQMAGAGDSLAQLQASARSAFGGYGRFRRMLKPERLGPNQI